MSSIIIDKLNEIEEVNKGEKHNYSSKSESECVALSREQTISILTKRESDIYEEYHTVKIWAGKLRSLTPEQRLFAEKAIYDVLIEAQLGNLNKSSVKINAKVYYSKPSHSIFTAKSSRKSLPLSKSSTRTHSACNSENCEREYRSSEVIIAESFPTEIGTVSSECQVKLDNIAVFKPCTDEKNKTYILRASPLNIATPRNSHSGLYLSQEPMNKCYSSCCAAVATNTPTDCILMQLRRYLRYFYNRVANFGDS